MKIPKIVQWLREQELLKYSQFTIDWVESTLDTFAIMEEANEPVSEKDFNGSVVYQVENILEVLKPDLPDVEFFKEIIKKINDN